MKSSIYDRDVYDIREISGKGVGCIASQDIEKGTECFKGRVGQIFKQCVGLACLILTSQVSELSQAENFCSTQVKPLNMAQFLLPCCEQGDRNCKTYVQQSSCQQVGHFFGNFLQSCKRQAENNGIRQKWIQKYIFQALR